MNIIKVTDQQLEYLQDIVMEAYSLDVDEMKDWNKQTFENMVDAVCGARAEYLWQLNKCHKITPFTRVGFYNMYIPHKQGAIYA